MTPSTQDRGTCRICSGSLVLARRGGGGEALPESFVPTCHRPGAHGDLYRCRDCGTVQQPSLPAGKALHDLYRAMDDQTYLAEQEGRRRTARRILDLLAPHVPRGRLLDVGSGHGLLLDEARSRGYATEGLELSRAAASHARDTLDLTVREVPLEDLAPDDRLFDAIILADVLEHLSDPVSALERCARALAPAGALVVVTPDPSSLTARVAGGRWWGYLPSHTYLLPRATLRQLIAARGLTLAVDVPLVRSFSAAYWLQGMAERGGHVGKALQALAGILPQVMLSLSLGDERVVVALR